MKNRQEMRDSEATDFRDLVGRVVLIRKHGDEEIACVKVVATSPSGRYALVSRQLWCFSKCWWIDAEEYELLEVIG